MHEDCHMRMMARPEHVQTGVCKQGLEGFLFIQGPQFHTTKPNGQAPACCNLFNQQRLYVETE